MDASKVGVSGLGLSPGAVRANVPQSFTVDTRQAGSAPLAVTVQGPKGGCCGGAELGGRVFGRSCGGCTATGRGAGEFGGLWEA